MRQWRSQLDKWGGGGGGIFIYSCSAQLISFEIDCFYGLCFVALKFAELPDNHNLIDFGAVYIIQPA